MPETSKMGRLSRRVYQAQTIGDLMKSPEASAAYSRERRLQRKNIPTKEDVKPTAVDTLRRKASDKKNNNSKKKGRDYAIK